MTGCPRRGARHAVAATRAEGAPGHAGSRSCAVTGATNRGPEETSPPRAVHSVIRTAGRCDLRRSP